MDAKSKAEFVNSVAKKESILCQKCGTKNELDSKYCFVCGAELQQVLPKSGPAFNQVENVQIDKEQPSGTPVVYEEPESVFADGLPAWDILPPQVVVRRR